MLSALRMLWQYYWEDWDEVWLFARLWIYHYYRRHPNIDLGGFTAKQRLAMVA